MLTLAADPRAVAALIVTLDALYTAAPYAGGVLVLVAGWVVWTLWGGR